LKTGNNIHIKGKLSARLEYTLNQYLIPAVCLGNAEFKKIKVKSDSLCTKSLNIKNLAVTGLSCGIDSLATYASHLNQHPDYAISYFTFFNAGSHGDFGGEFTRSIYHKRLHRVKSFANQVNIPLISVDTNLSEILRLNFQQTHSLRNISCALHLQKLFSKYYYASAYRLDHFKINSKDTSDSDFLYLNMLSTESTTFFSSVSQYSRVERTLLITKYPETYKHLDVCTNPRENDNFINCSVCYKCMRTQLTLDIAGCLEKYEAVFNIPKYKDAKKNYIGELLFKKYKSPLDKELIAFLQSKQPISSFNTKIHFTKYWASEFKKKIKKRIKSLIN
jgi:hypothetical protein